MIRLDSYLCCRGSCFIHLICIFFFAYGIVVPQRVSHVRQELLIPQSTWVHPTVCYGVRIALSSVFFVVFCRSLLTLWPFYFVLPFFIASDLPLLESVLILTVRRIFPPIMTVRRAFSLLWLSIVPCLPVETVQWIFSPRNCQMELFSVICCYFYSNLRSIFVYFQFNGNAFILLLPWLTFIPCGYHTPRSQCFGTDMVC